MPAGKPRLSPEDRVFFRSLGARIAALRKERGWTQVELAEMIGASQPRIVQFEKGWRRVPVSELAQLAKAFGVSLDELAGIQSTTTKRGPAPLLQRQLERLSKLPRTQQRVVSEMLEGFLQRAAV